MSNLRRLVCAAVSVCLMLLSSCSTVSPAVYEPVEVSVVGMFGGTDANTHAFNSAVEEYMTATNNRVVAMMKPADTTWELQVLNDFASGAEPDVLQYFTSTQFDAIVSAGKLVSIDEIRESYPGYADNISDNALKQLASKADGKTYAVPTNGYWEGMYVNTDVLKRYGLTVPRTWLEFLNICSVLRDNGVTPIGVALNDIPHYIWEFYLYNHTKASTHNVTIPKEAGDKAFKAYVGTLGNIKAFYEKGYFPPNTFTVMHNEVEANFCNKQYAFFIEGNWARSSIEELSKDISTVELVSFPTLNSQNSYYIGGFSTGFMISRKAWNDPVKRDACVKFVETVTSDKYIAMYSRASASPSKNQLELPEDAVTPLLTQSKSVIDNAGIAVGAVQDNWTAAGKEYMFTKGIGDVCQGKITPEECVKTFIALNV